MKYVLLTKIHRELSEEAKNRITENIKNLHTKGDVDEIDEHYDMPKSKLRSMGLIPSEEEGEDKFMTNPEIIHLSLESNPYIEKERKILVPLKNICGVEEIDETHCYLYTTEEYPFKVKNKFTEIITKIENTKYV